VWFIAASHPASMKYLHTGMASVASDAVGNGWWDCGWSAEGLKVLSA